MKSKKNKVSSNTVLGAGCSYSPTVHIDFDDLDEVKGVGVGDKVRILLTGTVRSVEARESYDESQKKTSSICLKDFEAEIVDDSNEFSKLADDEDD